MRMRDSHKSLILQLSNELQYIDSSLVSHESSSWNMLVKELHLLDSLRQSFLSV